MKIGILTFHRALNYGAVLQCYALNETLKSMGHDVEVIDYRPSYIEKYRRVFYAKELRRRRNLRKIRYLVGSLLLYPGRKKTAKVFDNFLHSVLKFSCRVRKPSDIPSYYDAIFWGSDQIWNPRICEGMDPIFTGSLEETSCNFISYAASAGSLKNIEVEYIQHLCQCLQHYDAISVREEQLKTKLSLITGKPIMTVMDPVFLLPESAYRDLAVRPQAEKYVLLYTLEPTSDAIQFAERIAKEKNCRILKLQAIPSFVCSHQYREISALSPQEFLGYFMYATFVVAVSFHGTAMSVIFKKDFYTLHSKNGDRAFNLLSRLGLQDRIVTPTSLTDIESIDYRGIDEEIVQLRTESMNFIKKALHIGY